jgi:hypothetical protein
MVPDSSVNVEQLLQLTREDAMRRPSPRGRPPPAPELS